MKLLRLQIVLKQSMRWIFNTFSSFNCKIHKVIFYAIWLVLIKIINLAFSGSDSIYN